MWGIRKVRSDRRRAWRRMVALVSGAGLVVTTSAGATFGLFASAAFASSGSFTAGTVILAAPTAGTCSFSNLEPGQASTSMGGALPDCTYTVTYSGSLAGWVALDVTMTSPSPSDPTTPALYNGQSDGLQVQISDSYGNTYSVHGANQLVAKTGTSDTNADGSVNAGWSDTFTVDYSLPKDAPGSLSGGTATLQLIAHAVQESNNPMTSCGPQLGWTETPDSSCGGSTASPAYGYTVGYWKNKGQAQIPALLPVTLGGSGLHAGITDLAQANDVLDLSACESTFSCTNLTAGLKTNTFDNLAAQTLALTFNVGVESGMSGETLVILGCTSDIGSLSLTGSSTVSDVLGLANSLVSGGNGTTTQTQAGDMNTLLGSCINRI